MWALPVATANFATKAVPTLPKLPNSIGIQHRPHGNSRGSMRVMNGNCPVRRFWIMPIMQVQHWWPDDRALSIC